MKPSREEAEKLVGKRTTLPQQRGAGALNDLPKAASKDEKPRSMGNLGDPLGLKKSLRDREKAAGLKSGGMVRGCGVARKGHGKGTMR